MQKERLANFIAQCHSSGLKVTPQRTAIYEILMSSNDHPNAESISQKLKNSFPGISLDTVNRTLHTFAEIGIVHLVEGGGEPRRYDPDLKKHHHFRCRMCHSIIDFVHDDFNQLTIPIDISNKYKVLGIKVVIDGICDNCKTENV